MTRVPCVCLRKSSADNRIRWQGMNVFVWRIPPQLTAFFLPDWDIYKGNTSTILNISYYGVVYMCYIAVFTGAAIFFKLHKTVTVRKKSDMMKRSVFRRVASKPYCTDSTELSQKKLKFSQFLNVQKFSQFVTFLNIASDKYCSKYWCAPCVSP